VGDRRSFPPSVVVVVKALACELPSKLGVPCARLHVPDLRAVAVEQGIVAQISETTIWRWLVRDAIRPWQSRSWLFPRDPRLEEKAAVVLDLYHRVFEGQAIRDDDFVLCADEKTSIQARIRRSPTLAPARTRPMRVEHAYVRGGSLQYLAALDVHRARVFGRCEERTGVVPFGRLVTQVMTQEPYRSARRVFWIVDNGTSHRGPTSVKRLEASWPNLRLIHLDSSRLVAEPGRDRLWVLQPGPSARSIIEPPSLAGSVAALC
jgi:hypothetical protein